MGILLTPVNGMADLLANCEKFQVWLGAVDATAARENIFTSPIFIKDIVPDAEKYAVIIPGDQILDNPSPGTGLSAYDQSLSTMVLISEQFDKIDAINFESFSLFIDELLTEIFCKQNDGYKSIKNFKRIKAIDWIWKHSTKADVAGESYADHRQGFQYAFEEGDAIIS